MRNRIFDEVRVRLWLYLFLTYRHFVPKTYTHKLPVTSPEYLARTKLVFEHMRMVRKIRSQGSLFVGLFQDMRLKSLLRAARRSSWWRDRLQKFAPNIVSVEALEALPPVQRRELVQVPLHDLLTNTADSPSISVRYTSGSTDGTPFKVLAERIVVDTASYLGILMEEYGFPVRTSFQKPFIVTLNLFSNQIGDLPWNQCMAICPVAWDSAEKINDLSNLYDSARRAGRWILFTHVTELPAFLDHVASNPLPQGLSACFVVGQTLEKETRIRFERQLRCPIVTIYGAREFGLTIAAACPRRRDFLHVFGEWVYVEILDGKGKRLPQEQSGSIHITSLENHLMPLIRYDIGDEGKIVPNDCGCGNPHTLLRLEEKTSNVLIFQDGTERRVRGLLRVFIEEFLASRVLGFQLIQNSTNLVTVQVVVREGEEIDPVLRVVEEKMRGTKILPEEVSLTVVAVKGFPSGKGKHKPFVSLAAHRGQVSVQQ